MAFTGGNKGEFVDDDLSSYAIYVDSDRFVKFVVRHLDEECYD